MNNAEEELLNDAESQIEKFAEARKAYVEAYKTLVQSKEHVVSTISRLQHALQAIEEKLNNFDDIHIDIDSIEEEGLESPESEVETIEEVVEEEPETPKAPVKVASKTSSKKPAKKDIKKETVKDSDKDDSVSLDEELGLLDEEFDVEKDSFSDDIDDIDFS